MAKDYDYLLKVLLVGGSDVGKLEILSGLEDRFSESPFYSGSAYKTTTILLDGKRVKLQLWELGCIKVGIANGALKVNLIVEPPAVRKGQHATLRCLFDLGGAPLYSIKFYRGLREFYRHSPKEEPSNKIFAFPGINVDKSQSNASQVVIRNVGFGLSGNFSCEVTADAPFFSTATAAVQLQVVEYPEKRPYLWAHQERYEPGDVLRANCSSPPSRPRTELKFTLNNIVKALLDSLRVRHCTKVFLRDRE